MSHPVPAPPSGARPRALITRPAEEAAALAEALRARGIEPAIAPMLEAVPVADADLDLEGAQAVLLTSRNGARALAREVEGAAARRDLRVLAVGDATAALARELGFGEVESAAGDSRALADLAAARLDPAKGALVHVSGREAAGDLGGDLTGRGFAVRRAVLYETRRATELPPEIKDLLAAGGVDLALFFSPRTAATFVMVVREAGLEPACAGIAAICLSAAVAQEAGGLPWKKLIAAARPDMASMLAAVDDAVQPS